MISQPLTIGLAGMLKKLETRQNLLGMEEYVIIFLILLLTVLYVNSRDSGSYRSQAYQEDTYSSEVSYEGL